MTRLRISTKTAGERLAAYGVVLICIILPAVTGLKAEEDAIPREVVIDHLEQMRRSQRGMMNIAAAEGAWLERLIRDENFTRVLEIGTSNGYSAIWMGLGLRETCGRLITLEIDQERFRLARENIAKTGLGDVIEVRRTDALDELQRLEGPFDLVFIDAWKEDYTRYLELALPLVRPGGIIAAHNVFHTGMTGIKEYRDMIDNHPQLETGYVDEGSAGISISRKK